MFKPLQPPASDTSLTTIDLTASSQSSATSTPPSAKRQKTAHASGPTFPTPSRARGPRQTQLKSFLQTTPSNAKKNAPSSAKSTGGKSAKSKNGNASILNFFKPVATDSAKKRDGKDDALFIAHGGYGLDVSDPEDEDEDGEMWVAEGEGWTLQEKEKVQPVERSLTKELELVEGARLLKRKESDDGGGEGGGEESSVQTAPMEIDDSANDAHEMPPPPTPTMQTPPAPSKPVFNGLNLNMGSSMLLGGLGGVKNTKKPEDLGQSQQGVPESSPPRPTSQGPPGEDRSGSQEADSKMSELNMEDDTNDENVDEPTPSVFKLPRKASKTPLQSTAELLREDDITSTFISQPINLNGNHDSDDVEDFPDEENDEMGFEEQETMFGFDPAARAIERGFSQVYDDTPPDHLLDEIEFTQDDPEANSPKCPICEASLSNLSAAAANNHVNSCLDSETLPPATVLVPSTAPPSTPRPVTKPGAGWFTKPPTSRTSNPHAPLSSTPSSSSKPVSAFTKLMSTNAEAQAWASTAKEQAEQYGMRAAERSCPFYKILFNGPITVDAFRYGAVPGCKAYFLSHFHSDHYVGLSSKWDHGPIYCSRVTANLVRTRLGVDPKWVHDLPWEEWYDIPDVPSIRVNGLDANHCPGSMLFLFEKTTSNNKKSTRILHCGDFRACPEHLVHPLLRPPNRIDTVYLDTTYLNPKYAFPSQNSVITACGELCCKLNVTGPGAINSGIIKTLAKSRTTAPTTPRLLVLVGTYSIGKERVCIGIAQALKTRIYAAPTKLRTIQCLEDPILNELLTPDPTAAQVHMMPLQQLDTNTLLEYLEKNPSFTHIVGFRPSGWNYKPPGSRSKEPRVEDVLWSSAWRSSYGFGEMTPVRGATEKAKVFAVPYSEHSSFRELAMFMCALDVGKVIPTVNVGSEKSRVLMRGWIEKWDKQRKKKMFVLGEEEGGVW